MKILAVALADETRRFNRGYPPRGARLFLNPDLEIAGLMTLAREDQVVYQDEKVELLDTTVGFDLALLSTDFWQESRIREVCFDLHERGRPVVLFGPVATAKWRELQSVADSVVVGNIVNVWPELRADAGRESLQRVYHAAPAPAHAVPDLVQATKPAFDPTFQCLRAIVGCRCDTGVRPYCRQYLYHGDQLQRRDFEELTGEVCDLHHKHVYLLDEDVAQDRDFYTGFFRRVWHYKREWTVLAGRSLFEDPRYIHLLAKAGTRVVTLTEDWLNEARLMRMTRDRRFLRQVRNEVRLLHRERLLVGARISLFLSPEREFDYEGTYRVLDTLSIDFLLLRMFQVEPATTADSAIRNPQSAVPPSAYPLFVPYNPGLAPDRPTWWKNQFYDLNAIIRRSLRRPVRVGFYSTLRYYYPRSFAYRQNFLEGIGYPP